MTPVNKNEIEGDVFHIVDVHIVVVVVFVHF